MAPLQLWSDQRLAPEAVAFAPASTTFAPQRRDMFGGMRPEQLRVCALQVDSEQCAVSLSRASWSAALQERGQYLFLRTPTTERQVDLEIPLFEAANNELLEAAAAVVDEISRELGVERRKKSDLGYTRNRCMGALYHNITAGGRHCLAYLEPEAAEAAGKRIFKHLGVVKKRALAIDKAANTAARRLDADSTLQAHMSIELNRLLELLELRLERYMPVANVVPPAKGAAMHSKLMEELKALQEPRNEEEPPVKRSRQERVREPALDWPGEHDMHSLPWCFEGAESSEWQKGWAAYREFSRLDKKISHLQHDKHMLLRRIEEMQEAVEEAKRIKEQQHKFEASIRMLQQFLGEAVCGFDSMHQCARRHGWDGKLDWVDREGDACQWSDPRQIGFLDIVQQESLEAVVERAQTFTDFTEPYEYPMHFRDNSP